MKQKATPSGTDLSRPGREVDLLLVLNAAAASLQRSAHSEAEVFRAVREEVVGLGLYGGVSLLDERGERLVICAFADPDHTLARLEKLTGLKAEGFEFAVAGVDVYRQVVETGETVFVPDNSAVVAQLIPEAVRPFAGRILKAFGPMPALYAPLMAEERVQGTLNVAGAGLAPDDVPAMEAFAHHISVALENARLVAAMQQAYERLKESEARFRKLSRAVEQSPTSVLITNTDGIIEYVNPQFTQITGYVPEEVIGKTPRILKSGEHPPEFYQELWDTISSGKGWQGDICNRKKNGELYWELQSISPIRSVAGEITHFLSVRIDDTERKRTEEALRNIAQGVSATTGGAFFRSLVQYLARTLEVDYAFVGELAREKDESVRTIAVWAHGEMVANFEYHLAHTPCENVVGQRLCCYPHGVQQQFPRDHLLAEMEAESYIGTPLFDSAGRALGLMVVMDRQPLSNTKLAEAMLQIFAVRASAELERVWAEATLKAYARQQAAVADLGQRALGGIALSALMDEATAVVAQTLEVEYCKVLELLPDGDALLLRAGVGWQAGLVGQATVGAGTDSQAGYTLLSSEPVIVEDLRTETRFSGPPLLHDHGVVSGISVIIPGQDRPFGVLGAHTTRQRTFTRDDVHFLQAVANALATAIERRRTEAEIRRRNRELTLLNQVIAASAIAPSAEPEAVLETACRELALAFDVPQAAAALLNEEKTEAVVVAEYRAEGRPPALNETIPVKGNPSFQYLLGHKAPLVVADAQSDPRLAPVHDLMRQRGAVSLLILPLVIKGEVVGSLGLDAIEPRPFSAEEVEVAWTVADQAAGVLARTRLDRERRRLEEQYHQAQKMESVGRLAAGIAHDFNNLLTAINGFAALLQRELQPDDPRQESVSKILGSGQRAADLVRQLLAFSRKQVIEPKVLNLKTVVADMDKLLRRIIGEDIALEANCAPDLWPVQVDPAQMEQVIVNLAVNARDAMPEGGKLSIETSNVILDQGYARQHAEVSPGEYVLLAVSDTGVGMREEVKAHIFEPFFTTKEVSKGTGLGLATVFGIVKQSGGHIWVYSEEGQGATFKVYLPRAKETAPSLSGPVVGAEMPSGHETILLVEDDKGVRDLARRVLHTQGYTLLEAEDGQAALQLAARHAGPIHLLLTDVIMPGLSGKALAEQLAQTRPDLKILFISGYTDDAIAHHGVLVPGVALLPKPFSLIDLAHKVRAALDG